MSGYKPGSAQFGSIGAVFGEKSHTQTVSEMPSHTHIQNAHSHTSDGAAYMGTVHRYIGSGNSGWPFGSGGPAQQYDLWSTTATNQYTGGGQAFNVIQPTRAVLVVIKT